MIDQTLLANLEQENGLPAGILNAMMRQESGGNANALSPKGAMGYFQFMPATAKEYGVEDPSNFAQSASGAARYMKDLMQRFGGNVKLALAGYNAGPQAVAKHGGVPPFKETQDYVAKITTKMGLEDDDDLDLPPPPGSGGASARSSAADDLDLPPPPPRKRVTNPYTGVVQEREIRNPNSASHSEYWQEKIDKDMGGFFSMNTLGQVGASLAGGAIGGVAGAVNPMPGGTAMGGAIGGVAGNLAAQAYQLRNVEAPIEEKLEYLRKQGRLDMIISGGLPIIGKGATALKKLFGKTDTEKAAIENWFKAHGADVSPSLGIAPASARNVYKNVAERMESAVQDEIYALQSRLSTAAPDAVGEVYKTSRKEAFDTMTKWDKVLFSPFQAGTPLGSMAVSTNPVATVAQDVLNVLEKRLGSVTRGENKTATLQFLQDLAAGKDLPIETLIERKRGLDNIINFDGGDIARGAFEGSQKVALRNSLDAIIKDGLLRHGGAGASAAYATANAVHSKTMQNLNSEFMQKIMEKDPLHVAGFIAENATPQNVKLLKDGLARMVVQGDMSRTQMNEVMDAARRKWVEQNFNTAAKASGLWDSFNGKYGLELKRGFETLFDTPRMRNDLLTIARQGKAIDNLIESLPKRESGQVGAYAALGSVANAFGGAPASAGVLGTLYAATGIPRAAAHAAATGDQGIVNRAKYALNWFEKQKPETWSNAGAGVTVAIPPAVLMALQDVLKYAGEQGLDKLNESVGIPQ